MIIMKNECPFISNTVPSPPREANITRVFQDGVELNWLPPTEPNGEVHYVIYYTPENATEQSIDTGSNLTHYNLIGLERNRVYTNISVQAVNSVGRSDRSAEIAQYNHTPPIGKLHAYNYCTIACMRKDCIHNYDMAATVNQAIWYVLIDVSQYSMCIKCDEICQMKIYI